MNTAELKNNIIKKILETNDKNLLSWMYNFLEKDNQSQIYKLSEFEKQMIEESQIDYNTGNVFPGEDVYSENKKWLEE